MSRQFATNVTTIYDIFCPVPFFPSPFGFRRVELSEFSLPKQFSRTPVSYYWMFELAHSLSSPQTCRRAKIMRILISLIPVYLYFLHWKQIGKFSPKSCFFSNLVAHSVYATRACVLKDVIPRQLCLVWSFLHGELSKRPPMQQHESATYQ